MAKEGRAAVKRVACSGVDPGIPRTRSPRTVTVPLPIPDTVAGQYGRSGRLTRVLPHIALSTDEIINRCHKMAYTIRPSLASTLHMSNLQGGPLATGPRGFVAFPFELTTLAPHD